MPVETKAAKKTPWGGRLLRVGDKFSTRPAPGPSGPETGALLDWAKQRRRDRASEGGR